MIDTIRSGNVFYHGNNIIEFHSRRHDCLVEFYPCFQNVTLVIRKTV